MSDTADDRSVICPKCGGMSQQSRHATSPKRCPCGAVMVDAAQSENEVWAKCHPETDLWGNPCH